jgi:hypothetical protein
MFKEKKKMISLRKNPSIDYPSWKVATSLDRAQSQNARLAWVGRGGVATSKFIWMYRFDGGTSESRMEPRDYDPAIMEKKALAVYVAAENRSTWDQSLKIKFCYTVSIRSLSLRRFFSYW